MIMHERHRLLLLLTAGWQSAKWRSSLSLIAIDLHDTLFSLLPLCTNLCRSKKRPESLERVGRRGLEKQPASLKFSIGYWGLSHPACRFTQKSLRGLILKWAFWNANYTVALEHLKLISFVPHDCVSHVTSLTWQSPPQLPRRLWQGRGCRVVEVEGSRSSVLELQVTGEQKKRRREAGGSVRVLRSVSQTAVFPRQPDQTCWHLEGDGRQTEKEKKRWRAEGGSCRAEGADIRELIDAEPPGEGELTVILTQGCLFSRELPRALAFRDSAAFSSSTFKRSTSFHKSKQHF